MQIRVFIILLLFPVSVFSQATGNPDSLFNAARQNAYAGNYRSALITCKQLCTSYPDNAAYRLFTARVLAWDRQYNEARTFLAPLKSSSAAEVLELFADIELWSGNADAAIAYCDQALGLPGAAASPLLLKKAKALDQLGQTAEAIRVLNDLLAKDPGNEEANQLLLSFRNKQRKNAVSVSYLNSSFSNPGFVPWHFGYVEYQRRIPECPLLFRVNFGQADPARAAQAEIDAYPKLGKKSYFYLNTGYSNTAGLFPEFRAGAEFYRKLFRQFEISAGARYMKFPAGNVYIYTAYAGYYYKDWWFALRNYIVAPENKTYLTWNASARRYFGDENRYVSFDLIYGAAPYFFPSFQDIARTAAIRGGLQGQFRATHTFFIRPAFLYEYEEYVPGSFRNRWNMQITLMKKF